MRKTADYSIEHCAADAVPTGSEQLFLELLPSCGIKSVGASPNMHTDDVDYITLVPELVWETGQDSVFESGTDDLFDKLREFKLFTRANRKFPTDIAVVRCTRR